MTVNFDPIKFAEAWADPNTRRMTLGAVRSLQRESSRKLAKALGVSIFHYQEIEIGLRPLSQEAFLKGMECLGASPDYIVKALLANHQFLLELADVWPKIWRDQLEPLDFETRRDLILADKELQNCGLGDLLCDKSREAADPEEAVHLGELALLIMEASRQFPEFKRRYCGYARGHLGHALSRRGDSESAEAAFAQAIEEWMTGKGGPRKEDERQVERLASIVPGFPKAEALEKPKRARKQPKSRPK